MKKDGLKRVATLSELGQFNNRSVGDVLWAFGYIASQAALFGSFVSHMAIDGTYGSSAPQCFDDWLYEEGMTDADERRAWATLPAESPLVADDSDFKDAEIHWQTKFGYQNASTGVADIINLRAEEMLLTLAECKCRAEDYDGARACCRSFTTSVTASRATYPVWPTRRVSASIRTRSLRRSSMRSCSSAASSSGARGWAARPT